VKLAGPGGELARGGRAAARCCRARAAPGRGEELASEVVEVGEAGEAGETSKDRYCTGGRVANGAAK